MHSRIFQLSKQPIDTDMWPSADNIVEYSSTMYTIDYATAIENDDERKENVSDLVEVLNGMFVLNEDGLSMTYMGGMDVWKKKFIETLKMEVALLTPDNLFHSAKTWGIRDLIKRPLGGYLFTFDEDGWAVESDEFMEWADGLAVGDVVYVGAVMDYHF